MRRAWNHVIGPEGSGRRHAQSLAGICTLPFAQSTLAIHASLLDGDEVRITALRTKVDAEGNELENHKLPGDYLTVAYAFDAGEEGWQIPRAKNFEGERAAEDFTDALALQADRDFCEAMVQMKCALDRLGGRVIIRPVAKENVVVGFAYQYDHLVRDQTEEPDSSLPEDAPEAETPEEMNAELDEEREVA